MPLHSGIGLHISLLQHEKGVCCSSASCPHDLSSGAAELPALVKARLDLPNWRSNLDTSVRHFKKTMLDTGSVRPLQGAILAMFVFNWMYSLPREMTHNKHDEEARFKIHHHQQLAAALQ
jgi:hypothetical protein